MTTQESLTAKLYHLRGEVEIDGNGSTVAAEAKAIAEEAFAEGFLELAVDASQFFDTDDAKLDLIGKWVERLNEQGDLAKASFLLTALPKVGNVAEKELALINKMLTESKDLESERRISALGHAFELTKRAQGRQRDAFALFRLAESDPVSHDLASQDSATQYAARILASVDRTSDLRHEIQQELSLELALIGKLADATNVAKDGSSSDFFVRASSVVKLCICRFLNRIAPHRWLKAWFAPDIQYRSNETGITQWTMQDLLRWAKEKNSSASEVGQVWYQVNKNIEKGDLETATLLIPSLKPYRLRVEFLLQVASLYRLTDEPRLAQKVLRSAAELAAECDSYQYRETGLLEIATLQKTVATSEVAALTIRRALAAVPVLADKIEQAKAVLRIAHTQIAIENYDDAKESVTQAATLLLSLPPDSEIAELIKRVVLMQLQLGLFADARKSLKGKSWDFAGALWLRQIVEVASENRETVHRHLLAFTDDELKQWIIVWYELKKGSVANAVRLVSEMANTFNDKPSLKTSASLKEDILYWVALEFMDAREFDSALAAIRRVGMETGELDVYFFDHRRILLLERLFQEAQKTHDESEWASKIITTLMFDQPGTVAELCLRLERWLKTVRIGRRLLEPEYWLSDEAGQEALVSKFGSEEIKNYLDDSFVFISALLSFQSDFLQANEVAKLIKWQPKRDVAYKLIVAKQLSKGDLTGAEDTAKMISGLNFRDEVLAAIAHEYTRIFNMVSTLKIIENIEDPRRKVRVILQSCRETLGFASCRAELLTQVNEEERKTVTEILKLNESDYTILHFAFALIWKTSNIQTKMALFFEIAEQLHELNDDSTANLIDAMAVEFLIACSSEINDEINNYLRTTSNRFISIGDFQAALSFASRVKDTAARNSILCNISLGYSSTGKFSDALEAASRITDSQGAVAVSRIVRDLEEAFSESQSNEAISWLDLIEQAIRLTNTKQWLSGYDLMPLLSLKARLAAATKNIELAAKTFIELANQEDVFLETLFSSSSDEFRLPFFEACLSHMHWFVSLVVELSHSSAPDKPVLLDAYGLMLKRKGLLTQRRRKEVLVRLDEANAHLLSIVHRLRMLREQRADVYLKHLLISSGARLLHESTKSAESDASSKEIESEINRLEIELSHLTSSRIKGDTVDTIDPYRVADAMPSGSVLIDFIRVPSIALTSNGHGAEEVFSKYFAFVLPAKQPHRIVAVDLGNTDEIESLIRKYREAVSRELLVQMRKPTVDTEFPSNRTAALIHGRVLQPLSAWIDEFETWFVSPDGLLNTLVFDALPWKQQDELCSSEEDANRKNSANQINKRLYVADTREISYVTSGRDVVNWSGKSADNDKITIVADPDFDWQPQADEFSSGQTDRGALLNNSQPDGIRIALHRQLHRGIGFEKLDAVRHEAEEIGKLFNAKTDMLTGRNATKANVKKIHSPKILHFATHGFYLDPASTPDSSDFEKSSYKRPSEKHSNTLQVENPLMHCGLALTGVNTWLIGGVCPLEIGNGILTGEEISSLNLSGTKLVVLAACETGLGRLRFGDGVYGLRRSLILAGAESAVVSLWNVPDDTTAILMQNYYKELSRGVGRSKALKNAKRALRLQDSGRWRHVGFWAGFILEGNPNPI